MRFPARAWWRTGMLPAAVLALALAGGARADPQWGLGANPSQAQVDAIIDRLAALPTLQGSEIDGILARLDFTPPMQGEHWARLSERDKLETAHRWAHAVNEENGIKFLNAVARDLAQRYESLRFDPHFVSEFHGAVAIGPRAPPKFARPASAAPPQLPDNIVRMLNTLAGYIDSPGPLSRVNLAKHLFDLEGAKLEQALGKRRPKDFLAAAIGMAPKPPPVHERLNTLMRDVMHYAESAGHDRRMEAVAAQLKALYGQPPDGAAPIAMARSINAAESVSDRPYDTPGNPSGGGGGGGGGSPQRASAAVETHTRFDAKFHPTPASRQFRSVRMSARGRGGVVAGAPVSSALGKAVSIQVVLADAAPCGSNGQLAQGRIDVKTASGSYTYPHVSCDILHAAARIAYQPPGNIAWQPGEAIGLATIDTAGLHPTFPLFVPANGDVGAMGRRWRLLLHPALTDTAIGSAVGLLDMWPRASQQIVLATGKDRAVMRWIASIDKVATWKWSDAPATIVAHGSTLAVQPRRGKTLLSMRTFTGDDVVREALAQPETASRIDAEWTACKTEGALESRDCKKVAAVRKRMLAGKAQRGHPDSGRDSVELAAAAPSLTAHLPDFARTEQLLRVLAIFRWARQDGAMLGGGDVAMVTPRPKTPDTIVVGVFSDFIAAAPAARAWTLECREMLKRIGVMTGAAAKASDARAEYALENALIMLAERGVLTSKDNEIVADCEERK